MEDKESREGGINESKGNLEYAETEKGMEKREGRDGGGGGGELAVTIAKGGGMKEHAGGG